MGYMGSGQLGKASGSGAQYKRMKSSMKEMRKEESATPRTATEGDRSPCMLAVTREEHCR